MRGFKHKTLIMLIIIIISDIFLIINTVADKSIFYESSRQILLVSGDSKNYKTIQQAIDNAKEGDIIRVKTGIYNETINVRKRVILEGENRINTILNPISEKNKYAIWLGAQGIIIRNFSITNRAPGLYTTGIRISDSDIIVQDCNIFDTQVGIVIWSSNNFIRNCSFWGCGDEGIALIGNSNLKCNNNKISNCIFSDNCDGIELQYSTNNEISDCIIFENSHTGIDVIRSSNNNFILNCEIYKNKVHGIYLGSSSKNHIINCSISENKDGNIIIYENFHNIRGSSLETVSSYKSRIESFFNNIRDSFYRGVDYQEIEKDHLFNRFMIIIYNIIEILKEQTLN